MFRPNFFIYRKKVSSFHYLSMPLSGSVSFIDIHGKAAAIYVINLFCSMRLVVVVCGGNRELMRH